MEHGLRVCDEMEERLEGHLGVVEREVERLVGARAILGGLKKEGIVVEEKQNSSEKEGCVVEKGKKNFDEERGLVGLGVNVVDAEEKVWPLVNVELGEDTNTIVEEMKREMDASFADKGGITASIIEKPKEKAEPNVAEEKVLILDLGTVVEKEVEKKVEGKEAEKEPKKNIDTKRLSQGIKERLYELGAAIGLEKVGPLTRLSLGDLELGRGWSGLWEAV